MKDKVYSWLDTILKGQIPKKVVALNFNLYENTGDKWSIELVGTGSFDLDDEDWACNEVTNFGTRKKPFQFKQKAKWDVIDNEIRNIIISYLEDGEYANILKKYEGVGVGFADGNVTVVYKSR